METLTVTLSNGEVFTVIVTDAKDAVMNEDGVTVQTIPNPSGTTIDIFDYWLDDETEPARRGWPGYSRNGTTGSDSKFWELFWNTDTNTNGNNTGINQNHKLKRQGRRRGDPALFSVKTSCLHLEGAVCRWHTFSADRSNASGGRMLWTDRSGA